MVEWIPHDGYGIPVDGEELVLVRFRDGKQSVVPKAAKLAGSCWQKSNFAPECTITHYAIISQKPMLTNL